jgi:hypothetical protein
MRMKYLIFDWNGLELPHIFAMVHGHDEIALKLGGKPVRGGFIKLNSTGELETFGLSTALKVSSHPDDAILIRDCLLKCD